MKHFYFLIFSFVLIAGSASAQTHHFKFRVKDKSEISTITRIISIDNVRGDSVWAYANDKEFDEFSKLNYKITDLPLQGNQSKVVNMATTVAQMATWDRYPTYDVYIQMMNKFATDYPNLCQVVNIGTSVNGRQLIALKISDNVATHEAEPEYFYTSSMHGDETTGIVLLLRLASWLLTNYATNTDAAYIVDNFELYINPIANPDGTYAGGNSTVSGATRSNSNSVDLNRNFPDPKGDLHPDGETYQVETTAMMNFGEAHHFVMSANFHGGTELMNYPWDCWTTAENAIYDTDWYKKVCTDYVSTSRLVNANYMTYEYTSGVTQGADWYYAFGSRQDYMVYYQNCREITIELSITKLLSTDQLNAYWNYNFQSLLNFVKPAALGFNGTVKDANGNPINAKIEIVGFDKDNTWVFTDPANGDYYRPIKPGTYNVTYSAWGYISQTHTITVNDYNTSVVKNVVLAQAPQITLTGTVTVQGTGNPISGVSISVLNTPISSVTTDATGNYTINNVPENTYDVKATKSGFTTQTKNLNLNSSNTVANFSMVISTAESFETNVPVSYTNSGNLPWTRVNVGTNAYDGSYCMKSGAIGNSQSSTLQIVNYPVSAAGTISFYRNVSSEAGYDFLKFYIGTTEKGSWSGTSNTWTQFSYPVSAGTQTFKWTYSKDTGATSGSDCAWIDYVELPATTTDTNGNFAEKNSVSVYPNPLKDFACIAFSLENEAEVSVEIIDINGKIVQNVINEHMTAGSQTLYVYPQNTEGQRLNPGVYFYRIQSSDFHQIGKLVIE
jgi:hypothetical protein